MKKFLLLLSVILFTCISAQANTVSVQYMGGHPVSVSYGAGPSHSVNNFRYSGVHSNWIRNNSNSVKYSYGVRTTRRFAQPYSSTQRRFAQPAHTRAERYQQTNIIVNAPSTVTVTPVSRFDKSYQRPVRNSYTRGGVTYYN